MARDNFTPRELSAELSVSVRTLQRWRTAGKGPAFTTTGGTVRYTKKAVQEWMESRRKLNAEQS